MKLLLCLAVVIAVCWFFLVSKPSVEASANVTATAPKAPDAPRVSTTPKGPSIAAPQSFTVRNGVKSDALPNPSGPQKIDLSKALDPDNRYHDDQFGLSANLPEGWKIRDAIRWGNNDGENTVFLNPDVESSARPSMYYRLYKGDEVSNRTGDAEALMRDMAEKKEASRNGASLTDYKNVSESFDFTTINGNPSLSYFATFTQGDQVMTEYFIRVLGPTGYVMFFTTGKLEDVKTIMPQLKQIAASMKVP